VIEQIDLGVCRGYRWHPGVGGVAAERVPVVLPGRMLGGTPAVSVAIAALLDGAAGDRGCGAVQVWDEFLGPPGEVTAWNGDLAHELSDRVVELEDADHGLGGPKGVASLLENLGRPAAATASFAGRL
jgi:hypothetical protein